jgi:hypothetical protein
MAPGEEKGQQEMLPQISAWKVLRVKSMAWNRARVLAHNLVHKIC